MEAARPACPLKDGKSLDCGGISESGFSVRKETREETTDERASRVQKGVSVRHEMEAAAGVGSGEWQGMMVRGHLGPRYVMLCSAHLSPSWWLELCP